MSHSEQKRGCGYRKIGGLYLVSDPGSTLHCDGLPLPLEPCGCCGFNPPFSRNLQKIQPGYISQAENNKHIKLWAIRSEANKPSCQCPKECPLCYPQETAVYGLMFVGKQSYTPESFIKEAFKLGVSKRIPEIPSWLTLGETWIFLAHNETPEAELSQDPGLRDCEPETIRAIFYAFKPSRIEMPLWKTQISDEEIRMLEEKGITPVFLDMSLENLKRHKPAKNYMKTLQQMMKAKLKQPGQEHDLE